ncbi:hypothetical protein CC78DRAFT_457858, partial [Lojkania enalia]
LCIESIDSADHLDQEYHCISEAFGRQAKDAGWISMNPCWETPQGQKRGTAQLANR